MSGTTDQSGVYPPNATAPSVTESDALTILRAFILQILPAGVEVVKAQDNRVPEPTSDNFVIMTPLLRTLLDKPSSVDFVAGQGNAVDITVGSTLSLTVQLDFHGSASGDNATQFVTLFYDAYAADFFSAQNPCVAPLDVGPPRQVPFINAEEQYEYRWTCDAQIELNLSTSIPVDSYTTLGAVSLNQM